MNKKLRTFSAMLLAFIMVFLIAGPVSVYAVREDPTGVYLTPVGGITFDSLAEGYTGSDVVSKAFNLSNVSLMHEIITNISATFEGTDFQVASIPGNISPGYDDDIVIKPALDLPQGVYTDTLTITFQFGDAEGSAPSYTLTRQVTITIGQAPAAIISPDSVSVYKGQTETFQVVTSGSTPFTYSLSGEPTGVSIASDTGAMSINTTSLAVDEYSFTIHASGSYGDGATQSFTLHVIEPGSAVTPTITTHPASAVYATGATAAALEVAATVSDGGALSFQWFSNTEDSTTGGTAIDGATSETYTPDISEIGTTYYYAEVTNAKEGATSTAISNAASIEVRQATAPTITSDNYTSIVSEDGGTFQVLADGFGYTAPSYTTSGAVPPSGFSLDEDSGLMAFAAGIPVGVYTFTITVANGVEPDATQTFTLTVKRATTETPTITTQPADGEYVTGDTAAALSVVAGVSDDGTLSYQWYDKDDAPISGATSATYLPDISVAGSETYYVIVTNTSEDAVASASATSTTATITVEAFAITSTASTSVAYGVAGTFDVTTNATNGMVSYSLSGAPTGVSINTDGEIAIAATTQGGTHTFTITANHNGEEATQSFTLTITVTNAEEPNIVTQPVGANYKVGDTATALRVAAEINDGGTLSYEWYIVTEESNTQIGSGQTFTPPTDAVGTFEYFAVVTNANNHATGTQTASAESDTITITVRALSAPTFTSDDHTTAPVGTETTFPVTATSEIAPITYALSGTVPTDVTIHADTGTLTIPASLAAGDYTFTITATNEDGATNQTFTLYMRPESAEVPTITTEPASASYVRGDTVAALSVVAGVTDGGILTYQWYKDGELLAGATGASHTPDITAVGSATYYVIIKNTNNYAITPEVTETSATVTIGVAAFNITSSSTQMVDYGVSSTFDVTTNAASDVTFSLSGTVPAGVTINETSGVVTAAATTQGGEHSFVVTADHNGVEATQNLTLFVEVANAGVPTIVTQPTGDTYKVGEDADAISVVASVNDGGTLSYRWYAAISASSYDGATPIGGELTASYVPDTSTIGEYYYFVKVLNTNSAASGTTEVAIDSNIVTIVVDALDRPTFTSTANTRVPVGIESTYDVTATSTVTPITYVLDGAAPTGVSINETTGVLTVAASVARGTYSFVITASNDDGDTTQNFTLYVIIYKQKCLQLIRFPAMLIILREIRLQR